MKAKVKAKISSKSHIREATQSSKQPSKFKVILIQEGLGNLKDCYYYSKEALKSAPDVFNGKKCFADHPSDFEEQVRPERSTRDIIGHFENVKYEESDGRGMLVADLLTIEEPSFAWAQALLKNSIQYSQKFQESDFVGLSINATGEAQEVGIEEFMTENKSLPDSVMQKLVHAKNEGVEAIRIVSKLTEAVSCDLVTEAGAGGRILKLLERNKPMGEKEGMEDQKLDGAKPDHADEEQDIALFKKLISQYLGEEHAESKEALEMAQHAYEVCQADGMEKEAAMEKVGAHLKMSKAVSEKMKQKKEATEESSEKEAEECGKECHEGEEGEETKETDTSKDAGKQNPGKTGPLDMKKKESKKVKTDAEKLVEAIARIASLEEQVKKADVEKYLEKKLSESKLPNRITKKFREALGTPKSKEQIDHTFKVFVKAYEGLSEEVGESEGFVFTEKSFRSVKEEGTEGSFAHCAEE